MPWLCHCLVIQREKCPDWAFLSLKELLGGLPKVVSHIPSVLKSPISSGLQHKFTSRGLLGAPRWKAGLGSCLPSAPVSPRAEGWAPPAPHGHQHEAEFQGGAAATKKTPKLSHFGIFSSSRLIRDPVEMEIKKLPDSKR